MPATTSNTRPIAIFTGYMVLAVGLTITCISVIRRGFKTTRSHNSNRVILFTLLSVVSLATTWYHMFQFFAWSYRQWELSNGNYTTELRLGDWLRETTLFKQAWASTLETPQRAWWSMQIFGFCTILSVMLPVQKARRGVPSAWAFMLLGQVVAISFASNLFFLAVLARDAVPVDQTHHAPDGDGKSEAINTAKKEPATGSRLRDQVYNALIVLQISIAIAIPRAIDSPHFLPLLLSPHILAFAPFLLNAAFFSGPVQGHAPSGLSLVPLASVAALCVAATAPLFRDGGNELTQALVTLYEHPAVSSVGWDVICCWVSYLAWFLSGGEGV